MMEQNKNYGSISTGSAKKNKHAYLTMNVLLLIIFPTLSIAAEYIFEHEPFTWLLIGKWFIFWAIGIRLFTAGISQASNPGFTAGIFHMKTQESYTVIRELGFANISLGIMGILSVINEVWRLLAAVAGGIFLGLAGLLHLFKKPDTRNELIAMLYDLSVLLVVILYLLFTIFI
jgi:hypothetical protein